MTSNFSPQFTTSTPSSDSSLWYILTALIIAVACGVAALWFLCRSRRPQHFKDSSKISYRLYIVWIFYTFGISLLALAVTTQKVISLFLIPWQQIQIGSTNNLAIYINQDNVYYPNSTTPEPPVLDTVNIVISGQLCWLAVGNEWNPPYTFDLRIYETWIIIAMITSLLVMLTNTFVQLKLSLHSPDTLKRVLIQYTSYSTVIAAGYFTLVESDYCYGYNSAYTAIADSSDDVTVSGDFTEAMTFLYGLSFAGVCVCPFSLVWNYIGKMCFDDDCGSGRLSYIFLALSAIMGIVFRVVTFLQGFDSFLTSTFLSNDVIFHLQIGLSLVTDGILAVTALYYRIRMPAGESRRGRSRLL